MNIKKFILIAVIATFLSACEKYDLYVGPKDTNIPTTNLITAEKADHIFDLACNSLNDNKLIGMQISIRDSLNDEWTISLGSIDLKQSRDIESENILRIGSVSKIYTASLILRLVEEDYIQLDQLISDFYPEIANARDISIRNLLNHSSGIIDIFSIPSIFILSSNFPDKKWNPNELAELCLSKKLRFTPGTENSYSNSNYIILGLIAEEAVGKKIDQLFTEYITGPLNLNHTYMVPYMGTPAELINGYVHHYALSLNEWYITEPENTAWSTVAYTAGSMATNSSELSEFTHHLFAGDIIGKERLDLMSSFSGKYGMGLFKIGINDSYYWGHKGEITGFRSISAFNPDTKIVISICCNTTPFKIENLLKEIDAVL